MAKRLDEATERRVLEAYLESPRGGRSLAAMCGIGATTLYRVLKRNGVPIADEKRHGRSVRRFSLSEAQQQTVIMEYGRGARSTALAREYNVCKETILDTLHRHGLPGRTGRPKRESGTDDLRRSAELAAKGWSQERIGKALGACQATVSRWLRMQGIRRQQPSWANHASFKGGRMKTPSGYVQVLLSPDDPMLVMAMSSGYILEHRLVMARQLGRPLMTIETVHHINGKKDDNRPENLELRVGKHGKGVRLVCQQCGSSDIRALPLSAHVVE